VAANTRLAPIHDRMPALLAPQDWATWLNRQQQDPAVLAPLLQPCPTDWVQAWPVSRAVSRGTAEGPELIEPLQTDPA
jgi:putative SOS response-associated peptidase YedK